MAMDNYIWLLNKKNDSLFAWPFFMSLALHLMLFAVLVIKPVYPLTGETERLDSIWLYFNSQSQGQSASSSPPAPEVLSKAEKITPEIQKIDVARKREERLEKVAPQPVHSPQPQEITEPELPAEEAAEESEPVTEFLVDKTDRRKPAASQADAVKKQESTQVVKKEAAKEQLEKVKQQRSGEVKPLAAETAKKEPALESRKVREPIEEKVAKSTFANASSVVRAKIAHLPTDAVKVVRTMTPVAGVSQGTARPSGNKSLKTASVVVADKGKPAVAYHPANSAVAASAPPNYAVMPAKENANTRRVVVNERPNLKEIFSGFGTGKFVEDIKSARAPSGLNPVPIAGVSGGSNAGKISAPAAATVTKPENKSNTGKTADAKSAVPAKKEAVIAIPPLTGDLKLEIKGNTDLKVSFAFREFLKSRRNRPLSAAEARRFVHIAPRIARPKENLLEAVLGTTGEGIYDITVEPSNGKPVSAAMLVRIYENGISPKTKSLGTMMIKGKTVIARILMPEGVFWDDDKYFSGNLEDSDSVTKFNSDSGLVWKEYKEPEQ